jgi:hypothetical protein
MVYFVTQYIVSSRSFNAATPEDPKEPTFSFEASFDRSPGLGIVVLADALAAGKAL